MHHLLDQLMVKHKGKIDCGEMFLEGAANVYPLPSGTYARWQHALNMKLFPACKIQKSNRSSTCATDMSAIRPTNF